MPCKKVTVKGPSLLGGGGEGGDGNEQQNGSESVVDKLKENKKPLGAVLLLGAGVALKNGGGKNGKNST